MKHFLILYFLMVLPFFAGAQISKKLVPGQQGIFKVSKARESIRIDGKMDENSWAQTEARTFNYYYEVENADEKQKTTLRMLWDEKNLYLFFECEDKYLCSEVILKDGPTYLDDCAEVFIIPVPDPLDTHIGFEINLLETVYDFIYFNNYYEGTNKVLKAYNPGIEVEAIWDGTNNDNSDVDRSWTMEIAIPISAFSELDDHYPMQTGSRWAFQAARQDRNSINSDHRSRSSIFQIYEFDKGGVHQPDRFGLMEFVE